MLFSRTAVHGIYTLCYLNQTRSGAALSAPAVAAALGIPREQAAKVLQNLSTARLVRSIRGRRGGYVLMKQLNEIPVVDVLDALNPPEDDKWLRPKTCRGDPTHMCNAHRGLRRLNDRVRQALVSKTLAELAGTVCSDSATSSRDLQTELLCVTQGEHSP